MLKLGFANSLSEVDMGAYILFVAVIEKQVGTIARDKGFHTIIAIALNLDQLRILIKVGRFFVRRIDWKPMTISLLERLIGRRSQNLQSLIKKSHTAI